MLFFLKVLLWEIIARSHQCPVNIVRTTFKLRIFQVERSVVGACGMNYQFFLKGVFHYWNIVQRYQFCLKVYWHWNMLLLKGSVLIWERDTWGINLSKREYSDIVHLYMSMWYLFINFLVHKWKPVCYGLQLWIFIFVKILLLFLKYN